jgi:pimeloyl-ACP methyl ester carboxylesterase
MAIDEYFGDWLKVIDKKVLILWGKRDRETPLYMGKRYHKLLPSSKLIVFKRGGHFSYLDYPMETISLIKSYIGGNE